MITRVLHAHVASLADGMGLASFLPPVCRRLQSPRPHAPAPLFSLFPGQNIVTGLVVDIIIGALCLLGFVVWRSSFPIYHARLLLPDVPRRPPKLRLDGLHRIW